MRYRKLLLTMAALTLIGFASVKPAMAYFTDYALATGYRTIKVHDSEFTPPTDSVENMVKTVSLTNTGDFDMYVRVMVICPEGITATMQDSPDWELRSDNYYYYNPILKATDEEKKISTSNLNLKISEPTGDLSGKDFNVIIVQEGTKVHYDADGNPYYNWSDKITERREY